MNHTERVTSSAIVSSVATAGVCFTMYCERVTGPEILLLVPPFIVLGWAALYNIARRK